MSNNVTYQIDRPATPPNQTIIETVDQGSGVMRQTVKVGESALPTDAATETTLATRALESGGNLASIAGSQYLHDEHLRAGEISQIGDLRVTEPYRLVGGTFNGTTIDTILWTAATSGTGATATQATNLLTLTSGTANSGYAQIQSVRKGRFIFGHPHIWRGAILIPDITETENTRRWGDFTTSTVSPTDGFFFACSGAGVLSVNRVSGGSVTSVASGSFNGEVASYVLDTNVHAYEIHYFVMQAQYFIDNVLIHTFNPTTANMVGDLTLPNTISSVNSGTGTESAVIQCWSSSSFRQGRPSTSPIWRNFNTAAVTASILKRSAGTLHRVTFNTIPNTCVITLYDAITATNPICIMNPPNGATPFAMEFMLDFYTGLCITTTPNAADVTVIYE